jgi:hypothetical protein
MLGLLTAALADAHGELGVGLRLLQGPVQRYCYMVEAYNANSLSAQSPALCGALPRHATFLPALAGNDNLRVNNLHPIAHATCHRWRALILLGFSTHLDHTGAPTGPR